MGTYGDLQTKVSRVLQDPDNATFDVPTIKDMIAAAWAEISRIAPERFQEDLDPVADALTYQLRTADFDDPVDDIEVQRVELWDGSVTPAKALRQIEPQSAHPMGLSYSQAGWVFWAGLLELPNRVVDMIAGHESDYLIRVWGYSPWPPVEADEDVVPFGAGLEEALVLYCHIEALRRLINNRALFTQWQTRSNNTDVTPAALMNDLNIAQEEWRRRSRAIFVFREAP